MSQLTAAMTKAKAKYGKLLKDEDYLSLMEHDSAEERMSFLRNRKNIAWSGDTAVEMESDLISYRAQDLKTLSYFLTGPEKDFYEAYISKYKIRTLKNYLRAILNGTLKESLSSFQKNPYRDDLRFEETAAVTFTSYVDSLKGTDFFRVLMPFLKEDTRSRDLHFYLSIALDRFYYANLMEKGKALKKAERKRCLGYVARQIDLYNIEFLYRTIRYYDSLKGERVHYLILGGTLPNETLDAMVEASVVDFTKILYQTEYSDLANAMRREDNLLVTNTLARRRHDAARAAFHNQKSKLLMLIAYVDLLDDEISDVTRILELTRLGGRKDLRSYLVRKME